MSTGQGLHSAPPAFPKDRVATDYVPRVCLHHQFTVLGGSYLSVDIPCVYTCNLVLCKCTSDAFRVVSLLLEVKLKSQAGILC